MTDHTARDEIHNLIARYCHHLDSGRPTDLAELFAEDAELVVMGKAVNGRTAIREWFEEMAGAPALSIHLTSNTAVELGEGSASALSNWTTMRLGPSSRTWRVFAVGSYDDEFVLTSDGWRFLRRIDSVFGDFTLDETIAAYLAAD